MKCDICKNEIVRGLLNLPGGIKYLLKIVRVNDRGVEMTQNEFERIFINICIQCNQDKKAIIREFIKRLKEFISK